uniref:Uncharacterized protein n=1 Tax=Steinernema glaseri TaxID=37863 RepID=A0A1I8AI94_9BILA
MLLCDFIECNLRYFGFNVVQVVKPVEISGFKNIFSNESVRSSCCAMENVTKGVGLGFDEIRGWEKPR